MATAKKDDYARKLCAETAKQSLAGFAKASKKAKSEPKVSEDDEGIDYGGSDTDVWGDYVDEDEKE
jgi:hypothetical protein